MCNGSLPLYHAETGKRADVFYVVECGKEKQGSVAALCDFKAYLLHSLQAVFGARDKKHLKAWDAKLFFQYFASAAL